MTTFWFGFWRTLRQDAPINPYAVAIGLGNHPLRADIRLDQSSLPLAGAGNWLLGVILAAVVVWAAGLDKVQKDDQGNVVPR